MAQATDDERSWVVVVAQPDTYDDLREYDVALYAFLIYALAIVTIVGALKAWLTFGWLTR